MSLEYAVNKINSMDDKIIICGCDAFSGLVIHYVLDQLFGREGYMLVHHFQKELEDELQWGADEPIPDKYILGAWEKYNKTRILTTCWDYERTLEALKDSGIQTGIRVYKFCDVNYPPTPF